MKRFRYFYEQLVTEAEMNDAFEAVQDMELSRTKELNETGVTSGLVVAPSSPISTSVVVSPGTGRITSSGRRVANDISQPVTCDADEFGNPTYSDLGVGEGRWCSIYVRSLLVDSDLRIDGRGFSIYYQETESLEFFLHRGAVGPIGNKDSLGRPGAVSTAIILADIWFEDGSTDIAVGDLEVNRREDYFRQTINGLAVVAGNPRDALISVVSGVGNLSEADLPTGANDGAHLVGLGGHASQPEWAWANGNFLDAGGDTVHDVVAKLVSDLGLLKTSGDPMVEFSGASLVSVDTVAPTWYDGSALGGAGGTYDGTIQGGLNSVVGDLKDNVGSGLIGSAPYISAAGYDLPGVESVQGRLIGLVENINDHMFTGGHASDVISYPGSMPTVFADGVDLPPNNVRGALDTLIYFLAQTAPGTTTAGTWKIGGSSVGATYGSKTINIAGGVSLANQLEQLCDNIVVGITVNGDDRLAGDFLPAVTNVSDLGDSTHTFAEVWSQQFKGSAISTLFRGEQTTTLSSGADLTIVAESGGLSLSTISGELDIFGSGTVYLSSTTDKVAISSYTGVIEFAKDGVKKLVWDNVSFYPVTGFNANLGENATRWNHLYLDSTSYFGDDINLEDGKFLNLKDDALIKDDSSRTFKTILHCSEFSAYTYDGVSFQTSTGTYISNLSSEKIAMVPLPALRPGMLLSEMEARWFPVTVAANMYMELVRQEHDGGSAQTIIDTLTATTLTDHLSSKVINHIVLEGYAYFYRIVFESAVDQRLYSVSITHNNPQWPL